MCDPVSIMTGLAVANHVVQAGEARAQKKVINQNADLQRDHTHQQASAEASEHLKEMRKERATAQVLAEAGGVAGNSIDAIDNSIQMNTSIKQEHTYNRLVNNLEVIEANRANQVASVREPNLFATGLQIAGAFNQQANTKA